MLSCRPARTTGLLLTAAAAAALCSQPATAQETTEGGGFFQMLGRIIFGTGTAKVAIDTPQAVTALEQEDLDEKQPETLSDLLKGIPGVQTAGASARPLGQAFNIRGVGVTEEAASEDRIKVTVDGAPKFFEGYRMGAFFGDLELFKRVEILRGPASATLYGSGAIGGVVAFTTKDASDYLVDGQDHTLRLKANGATNGDVLGGGLIYAQRAGNAEFLAALNTTEGDTLKDGAGDDILGTAHKSWSALFKAGIHFGNDNDQSLKFSWARTDTDLKGTQVVQTGGSSFFPVFGVHDLHTIDDTVTLTYGHDFAGNDLLDLSVQLSYTNQKAEKSNFRDGMASCGPGTLAILCDSNYGYETVALKIENVSDLSGGAWENYLTLGFQTSEQKRTAGTTAGGNFAFHPEGTDRRNAIYAHGEFTWNERLTLISGVRVEFGERVPSEAVTGGAKVDDTAISATLSAMYRINDTFALFGTYAQTERLPTLDEFYTSGSGQVPSLDLKKEEAKTFELGFTVQSEGIFSTEDSLALKFTAFHNDMTNLVNRNTGAGVGTPYYNNIAAAKIWGGELEASYDAERWFGSVAWSKVKSKNEATGAQLASTPAETVALTLGLKLPEQNLVVGWHGYYYDRISTGAAFTVGQPDLAGKAYDTHDIFLTWKPQEGAMAGLEVNLAVENIFDKEYINNLALDKGVGRNAKLTIAKNFTW